MIDEDPRFPNRKKREPDPLPLSNQLADASHQDPHSEIAEDEKLPVSFYRVIESDPETPAEKLTAPVVPPPIAAPADEARETSAGETLLSRLPLSEVWIERIQRFAQN